MKSRTGWLLLPFFLWSLHLYGEVTAIPLENQQQNLKSSIQDFDDRAKILLAALALGDFDKAKDLFFPEPAFLQLKAIAKPSDYYAQLMKWYKKDFDKESERFKNRGVIQFKAMKGGSCKWKAVNTEANSIPYWSCYKRKIEVLVGDKTEIIEIHALINWGRTWYITHLGAIPKS